MDSESGSDYSRSSRGSEGAASSDSQASRGRRSSGGSDDEGSSSSGGSKGRGADYRGGDVLEEDKERNKHKYATAEDLKAIIVRRSQIGKW